jgi:glycosyltransferase involved in cell wall biosynthesis
MRVILTSYNRPALLQRTLASLKAQTAPDWKCYLQDDNSNRETMKVIRDACEADPRFIVGKHKTSDRERETTTRYSVLINEILPTLEEGIVGYLCDNVEYDPELVERVLAWFAQRPDHYAGYVLHARDVWSTDGTQRLGAASDFGHWNILPPLQGPVEAPAGWLDHSQVFHRLPCAVAWNESRDVLTRGDGDFFTRLVAAHGPIFPIDGEHILTTEHLLEGRV